MGLMTCVDCGRAAEAAEGYLRPEGFVCRVCHETRLQDPVYVARLERELLGLVGAATGQEEPARDDLPLGVPLEGPGRMAVDSLVGLAVADALGAPYEGHTFDPSGFVLRCPTPDSPAPWTDDTQMALSVVEVLLERGEIDQDRLARAFARRYDAWRGYGSGMHHMLLRLRSGGDWRGVRFGVFPDGSWGNGSAMRVAPLGAFFADRTIDVVAEQAARSAEVTHAHPEGVHGAVATAVCAWHAARSRDESAPAPAQLLAAVRAVLPADSGVARGLQRAETLPPASSLAEAVSALGNGAKVSCVDTVPLAVWIVSRYLDDYETAVETAVAAGGDTDTLAAIVGGIVTARVSPTGIPVAWRQAVEQLPLVEGTRAGPSA